MIKKHDKEVNKIKTRDLKKDLEQLNKDQNRFDLSDKYLMENGNNTRLNFSDKLGYEFSYGITFVESWIAEEWLKRAIEAEEQLLILGGEQN